MKVLAKSTLAMMLANIFVVNPIQSKAEGGCPSGMFPVGGGYCRNIVCVRTNSNDSALAALAGVTLGDPNAVAALKKYSRSCGFAAAQWGEMMVPKR